MHATPRSPDVYSKLGKLGLLTLAGLGDRRAAGLCDQHGVPMRRAANEAGAGAGGFLVPAEIAEVITTRLEKHGLFRRHANRGRMSRDATSKPRRVGGAIVYNVAEGVAISESDMTWDNVSLIAKKPAALCRISSELLEDSEALGEEIANEVGRALAETEDRIGFAGNGGGADFGVKGIAPILEDGAHGGGAVAAAAGHNLLSNVDAADLGNLIGRLPTRAHGGASWWCSHLAFGLVFCRLAQAIGGIQTINGEPWVLGFPIRLTPTLPAVTSPVSGKAMLLLGDMSQSSVLGDRRELTLAKSTNGPSVFASDDVLIRATERVDIVNHDLGDATNPGAMVALIGAA